jgi:uncharacterized membrane protein
MAALHLVVRWLHLLGVAVMLGGSVLAWGALRSAGDDAPTDSVQRLAESYEWLFWAALGVVVLAGVGNLGALAPGVPGPGTRWGWTLAVKLVVLLAFVVLSVARSLAVVRARSGGASLRPDRLRTAYAATTAALLLLLALAEVLAHG